VVESEQQKQHIQATFDLVAEHYESNRFFELSAKQLVKILQPIVKPNKKLLDITTGTGLVALTAAQAYPQLSIEAVDISAQMLAQAKLKAVQNGISNVNFRQADIEQLDYKKNSFDVISCGYGLFFLPNLVDSFKTLFSLLKEGGILIFSTFTQEAFAPYNQLFLERLKDFDVKPPELSWKLLQSHEDIKNLCRESQINHVKIISYPIAYPIQVSDWWNLLNSAGYRGLLNQIPQSKQEEFKRIHLQEVAELAVEGELLLNADTLYGMVTRDC